MLRSYPGDMLEDIVLDKQEAKPDTCLPIIHYQPPPTTKHLWVCTDPSVCETTAREQTLRYCCVLWTSHDHFQSPDQWWETYRFGLGTINLISKATFYLPIDISRFSQLEQTSVLFTARKPPEEPHVSEPLPYMRRIETLRKTFFMVRVCPDFGWNRVSSQCRALDLPWEQCWWHTRGLAPVRQCLL